MKYFQHILVTPDQLYGGKDCNDYKWWL